MSPSIKAQCWMFTNFNIFLQMDGPCLPLCLLQLVHEPADHHVQQSRLQRGHPQHLPSFGQQLKIQMFSEVFVVAFGQQTEQIHWRLVWTTCHKSLIAGLLVGTENSTCQIGIISHPRFWTWTIISVCTSLQVVRNVMCWIFITKGWKDVKPFRLRILWIWLFCRSSRLWMI